MESSDILVVDATTMYGMNGESPELWPSTPCSRITGRCLTPAFSHCACCCSA
jgi:hypothetical protein